MKLLFFLRHGGDELFDMCGCYSVSDRIRNETVNVTWVWSQIKLNYRDVSIV